MRNVSIWKVARIYTGMCRDFVHPLWFSLTSNRKDHRIGDYCHPPKFWGSPFFGRVSRAQPGLRAPLVGADFIFCIALRSLYGGHALKRVLGIAYPDYLHARNRICETV